MRLAEENERFLARCRELEARMSPEEREHIAMTLRELGRSMEETTKYEHSLLRRLGVNANLDDSEEYYLRLWSAGRHMGLSTDEFWRLTPREFCALLDLKVREFELLAGTNELAEKPKADRPSTNSVRSSSAGRKRGPKPDHENARRVAEIVASIAPSGDLLSKLDEISDALDEQGIPYPKRWRSKDRNCRGWADQLDRSLKVKALKYRIVIAKRLKPISPKTLS